MKNVEYIYISLTIIIELASCIEVQFKKILPCKSAHVFEHLSFVLSSQNLLNLMWLPMRRKMISLNMISFESATGLIRNTLNLGVLLSKVCVE